MVAAAISVVLALWGVPQAGLGAAPAAVVSIGVVALLAGGALAVRFRREGIVRDGDVLSQALDLDPDALAAVLPDGGPLFVNIAFDRRFSPSREPPLVRIAAALADDPRSQDQFDRLRGAAAAGDEAQASLLLHALSVRLIIQCERVLALLIYA